MATFRVLRVTVDEGGFGIAAAVTCPACGVEADASFEFDHWPTWGEIGHEAALTADDMGGECENVVRCVNCLEPADDTRLCAACTAELPSMGEAQRALIAEAQAQP